MNPRPVITRRGLLAATGVGVGAAALSGCVQSANTGNQPSDGSTTITVLISADTNIQDLWQKSLIPGFAKANPGITVKTTFDLHGEHDQQNQAKLAAAVQQNTDAGFDIIDGGWAATAAQSGLLHNMTAAELPALSGVPESLIKGGNGGAVPYRASSVLLAYSNKVTNPPTTYTDLIAWIKANPGKFTYCPPKSGGSGGSFVSTSLDANLTAEQQTQMRTKYDPAAESAWTKGFDLLASLNGSVYQKGVYPNGNAQVLELLASGQIDLAPVWSDQFLTGTKNGTIPATTKVVQISEPSFTGGGSYLGVAKTTKHLDACKKLLEYTLSSPAQTLISSDIAGFPVIPLSELPADVQSRLKDAHPEQLRPGFLSDYSDDMNKQWDEKVPGK